MSSVICDTYYSQPDCYCRCFRINIFSLHPRQVNSSEENLSNCCIIQYVIFPPHHQLLMKPSEDSTESDVAYQEAEGDLQMVIEVWVEPQLGTIDEQGSPLSYLHGETYNKIPEKVQKSQKTNFFFSSYIKWT